MEQLPSYLLNKWQDITNLLAEIIGVPASLIMTQENDFRQVFISSKSKGNPFKVGDKHKGNEFYCQEVIDTQKCILVPNSLKDPKWKCQPKDQKGMISYLGYPINYPDNKIFGTLCVLDNKENNYNTTYNKLIHQSKCIIERDLWLWTKKDSKEKTLLNLATIVEQSANSIVITDTQGIIEYVNPKFTKTTGYTREESLGQNVSFLKSGYNSDDKYKKLWNTITNGKVWFGEFHNKRKNGEDYWATANVSPVFDINHNIISYSSIQEETTEKRNIQQELILAKEKAEESDLLKSVFLKNMNHEIRTPMNAIIGFSELLKDPDISRSEQLQYIDIISDKSNDLLAILKDILDISIIQTQKIKISLTYINIDAELRDLFNKYWPKAKEKSLLLSFKSNMIHEQLIIKSDKYKLHSVLNNILNNAIKYTNKGNIQFGYKQKTSDNKEVLEFFIKDTGRGIPENKLTAIFDSFVQAEMSGVETYKGAGLGLSISKAYIEALGGKIWVDSILDEGSKFYFTIPLVKKQQEHQS